MIINKIINIIEENKELIKPMAKYMIQFTITQFDKKEDNGTLWIYINTEKIGINNKDRKLIKNLFNAKEVTLASEDDENFEDIDYINYLAIRIK